MPNPSKIHVWGIILGVVLVLLFPWKKAPKSFQNGTEDLPKSMPKPSKFQVCRLILGFILELWVVLNINLDFSPVFVPFFRSRARLEGV